MENFSVNTLEGMSRLSYLPTGIAGFDRILGGGLPENRLYLIQGLAGSGKTTLACQIGFIQAKLGKKVLVLSLIAESHAKLLNHLSNFTFFDESLIGNQFLFFSGYSVLNKGGLKGLLALITETISEHKAEILIIDGFRSVRQSNPTDLALSEFMHSLNSLVSSLGCTTFLLSPVEGNAPESENTLVDGLIELGQHEKGMRVVREIKIYKIRGSDHLLGKHVFEVCKDGIVVYPRLEAIATYSGHVPSVSEEAVSFGIPSWDSLLGGGVKKGSTTNLLGAPGVGKTLMGLHFIHQGLRNGENCLILGFYESPPRLIQKAKSIGLDLEGFIEDGSLDVIWNPPLEILVDYVIASLFENIERRGVTRLFIDGVDGMRDIFVHEERGRPFLVAFVNEIRTRGVTTFFTQELSYFKDFQGFSDTLGSILYENMMLLTYVEIEGVKHRQISVMKLRENGYDAANHLMRISDTGITIDGPITDIMEDAIPRKAGRRTVAE